MPTSRKPPRGDANQQRSRPAHSQSGPPPDAFHAPEKELPSTLTTASCARACNFFTNPVRREVKSQSPPTLSSQTSQAIRTLDSSHALAAEALHTHVLGARAPFSSCPRQCSREALVQEKAEKHKWQHRARALHSRRRDASSDSLILHSLPNVHRPPASIESI